MRKKKVPAAWRVFSYLLVLFVLYTFYELAGNQFKNLSAKEQEEKVPCRVIRVYDGDTFRCRLESGEEVKVRLIGVDTPESRPNRKALRDARREGVSLDTILRLGKKATEFTRKLIPPGTVVYLETDVQIHDRYGRLLAYVYLPDGRMLNEVLLEEGYAKMMTVPPNVKYVERFRRAQRRAIREGRGLWSEGM
ncbi:MAG: thermonuclease family protein [Aquificota bacterium]|nr:thermonuclease family protein [Aquificota bacterium]